MSDRIPPRCPDCAVHVLARPEWFSDPDIVRRVRLAEARGISRLLSSPRLAHTQIAAITLRSTIYYRILDQFDPHEPAGLSLLAHEIKHVEQYERLGLVRFYASYLRDYMRVGYGEAVHLEEEAYKFQRHVFTQLTEEFKNNQGLKNCKDLGPPHTPNDRFAMGPARVFRA